MYIMTKGDFMRGINRGELGRSQSTAAQQASKPLALRREEEKQLAKL